MELAKNQSLGESFQLLIGLAEIHVPRMWVEEDPADLDNPVSMSLLVTVYSFNLECFTAPLEGICTACTLSSPI